MAPTVLYHCTDNQAIVKEEHFGPVMTVLSFDSENEVIERANNTPYGLAAGVVTQCVQRAHRVAHRLQAGTIWINQYNLTPLGLPFGGLKQSGYGRENCAGTLREYSQEKTVYLELDKVAEF